MAHESRFFYTAEQLENSASRRAGISADTEILYRQDAAYLIQELGIHLRVYVSPNINIAMRLEALFND